MTVLIYALCCPLSGEIRYVGKTQRTLRDRLSKHMRDTGATHKVNWIKSLNGAFPMVIELEKVEAGDWEKAETFWINYLRFLGFRLTNIALGGSGGQAVSPETRRKMSQNRKGKNVGLKRTQKPRTPEHRANLSKAFKGRRLSEETKAKVGAARRAIVAAKMAIKLGPLLPL